MVVRLLMTHYNNIIIALAGKDVSKILNYSPLYTQDIVYCSIDARTYVFRPKLFIIDYGIT